VHESFGRETGKLATQETRDFRLINPQHAGCASLGESSRANGRSYPNSEVGFGKTLFRVGKPNVGEDIAAAFLHFDCSSHRSAPF
jgi:hypothetical protein